MQQYHDLLQLVLGTGVRKDDRTGTGTYSIIGAQVRYSLENRFPLLTTKEISWKNIVVENLWFLSGAPHISLLK